MRVRSSNSVTLTNHSPIDLTLMAASCSGIGELYD
jgi:hypothetical protein